MFSVLIGAVVCVVSSVSVISVLAFRVASAATSPVGVGANALPPGGDPRSYAADWSQGPNGWPASFGWSAVDGQLRNNGSDFGKSNWSSGVWNTHWVFAPYMVPAGVTDYAVEAQIQIIHRADCGSFGLVARGAYQIGIHSCGEAAPTLSVRSRAPAILRNQPFDPGGAWHTYRAEVRGSRIQVLVDGLEMVDLYDDGYRAGESVGLWDDHTEIAVRGFRVQGLPKSQAPDSGA